MIQYEDILHVFRLRNLLSWISHRVDAVEAEVTITVIKGPREVDITLMIEVEVTILEDPSGNTTVWSMYFKLSIELTLSAKIKGHGSNS